jgi:hypothetical protein
VLRGLSHGARQVCEHRVERGRNGRGIRFCAKLSMSRDADGQNGAR